MQDRIGAPRSPTLRVCQQLRCTKTSPVQSELSLDADISGEERIVSPSARIAMYCSGVCEADKLP